jgi:hypothetical protein
MNVTRWTGSTTASLCWALAGILACATGARAVAAQDVPDRAAAAEVRKQFLADLDTLQRKFLALATAFPAETYPWRPAPGVRSVGEVCMHVASEFYLYTPLAYGATPSPVVAANRAALQKFETTSTKPEVLRHLHDGFEYAKRTLTALDPSALAGTHQLFGGNHTIVETSFDMTADLHEHLGQLIAYARMNHVTPPWSR